MSVLYTRTLNTAAATAAGVQALNATAQGSAWWTLVLCGGSAVNAWMASRTTLRLHPAPRGNGSERGVR